MLCTIIVFTYARLRWPLRYSFSVTLESGDTIQTIWNQMNTLDVRKMKLYNRLEVVELDRVEQGRYVFDGSYSPQDFATVITQ